MKVRQPAVYSTGKALPYRQNRPTTLLYQRGNPLPLEIAISLTSVDRDPPCNLRFFSSSLFNCEGALTRSTLEGLAEHKELDLIVDRKHTGTSDTTEDVGTSTLEKRADAFLGNDLTTGIQRRLILDSLNTVQLAQVTL